ncbi:sulfotransferase family protein [Solicola gregarius]|uniref:Sulfotransferase family protein n=1 Tax=Solicola gregarius TaxID=2908642 RepID=A0AA46YNT5_9ACTN|nr:sulfotransferase family protein [Solicola gregarius]UYM06973.1 sulfotransferase family protein [Solicola gregarius]
MAADSTRTGRIVIVAGPGRSGTSSFAGTLARLGLHVPEPVVKPNATNPAGFYEPRWVVDFHNRLLVRAAVRNLDLSPDARARAERTAAKPGVRAKLRGWLGDVLENQGSQLVIKDPRSSWFPRLWVETAGEFGIAPGFVTMLRHPAEVSTSRQTYYGEDQPVSEQRANNIARIGGWINGALGAERASRGSARAFVPYTDLVADWRQTITRVGAALDLDYDPAPDVDPHPVDEFIDPSLRRIRVDWDDVDIPDSLRDVGERAWQALSRLATEGADSPQAIDAVDQVAADYATLHADAQALSRHDVWRMRVDTRRRTERAAKSDEPSA